MQRRHGPSLATNIAKRWSKRHLQSLIHKLRSPHLDPTTLQIIPHPTNNKQITVSQKRMLYLIGLGLSNEKDITVAGLEIVKKAERVYLEAYTSILMIEKEKLVPLSLALAFQLELIEPACTGGFLRPSRHYRGPRNGRVLLRRYPRRRFYYRRSLPCRRRPLRVSLFPSTDLSYPQLTPPREPQRTPTFSCARANSQYLCARSTMHLS